MRTVLLWSLLALVPFSNLRMICFDHAGSAAVARPGAPDCAEFCQRKEAPAPEPDSDSGCVLVAGGCASVTALILTLSPPTTVFDLSMASVPMAPAPPRLYSSPVLDLFSPPPQI